MTIKEFLNNPIQGMIMLDKNTTLMKAEVIDRDNNQIIKGIYQVWLVDYYYDYDNLNSIGLWDVDNQIFYAVNNYNRDLFSKLNIKLLADLHYLFRDELQRVIEEKLDNVEGKIKEDKEDLEWQRNNYLSQKLTDLFTHSTNTLTFNRNIITAYNPKIYETARVIKEPSAVKEIIEKYLEEEGNDYSENKGRYLTNTEEIMESEIKRRRNVLTKRNFKLTKKEELTLHFFGQLALVPDAKNVKILYHERDKKMIFTLNTEKAKSPYDGIVISDATIYESAISNILEERKFIDSFGNGIRVENIEEVSYRQKVIYKKTV